MVTKYELAELLRQEKVPDDWYSLEGGLPSERWCIAYSSKGWEVYYSERGIKTELQTFHTEHEACLNLYSRIMQAFKR